MQMRKPEEIKKGLKCYSNGDCEPGLDCEQCPLDNPYHDPEDVMRDALELIEALEARVPAWISVKERLPENCDEMVLVIANGRPNKNIEFHDAYQLAIYAEGEGWIIDGFEEWEGADVKWWMPLPELPKEETNDG